MTCNNCGGNDYTGCVTEPVWCDCIGDDDCRDDIDSYDVAYHQGAGVVSILMDKCSGVQFVHVETIGL